MKSFIGAVLIACLCIGSAFAAEPAKEKDTFGSQGSFRYDPNNGKSPGFYEEGADITINYQWQLSTLLGEPVLKCQAAWQPKGVWVKRSSNSEPAYIKTKDLPPKVAASIRLVDLTVVAFDKAIAGAVFDCNVGIPAPAGKEFSHNLPTSPDWHEVLGNASYISKEDNARKNKEAFNKLLAASPQYLAASFEYKAGKIQFDLSGVRDWLAEQEEKSLAKKAKGPKAKTANLEKERAALAGMKEANAAARTKADAATAQNKADLATKEQQYKEKMEAGIQNIINRLDSLLLQHGTDVRIDANTSNGLTKYRHSSRIKYLENGIIMTSDTFNYNKSTPPEPNYRERSFAKASEADVKVRPIQIRPNIKSKDYQVSATGKDIYYVHGPSYLTFTVYGKDNAEQAAELLRTIIRRGERLK